MIDYIVELDKDQVVFKLNNCENFPFENYISLDGFLSIMVVTGGSDGWLGYGGLQIYLYNNDLPIELRTPHYEYTQDLLDVMNKIETNMGLLQNGNVLS